MSEDLGNAALRYALQYGWSVFPVTPDGKIPLIPEWPTRASCDPEQIREWWTRWPNANIGVACGASGLAVLDADNPDSLARLEADHGALPPTSVIETRPGHRHFLFANPAGEIRNTTTFAGYPKIDVRGDGGQFVAPPSVVQGFRRSWAQEADVLPAWPYPGLQRPREPVRADAPIPEGQRDTTLFRLASGMRADGWPEASILAALVPLNETQCIPPLGRHDLERIAGSAAKYEPNETIETNEELTRAKGRLFRPIHEFAAIEFPQSELLLGDDKAPILPAGALGMMAGKPYAGKSLVALDMGFHLAHGRAWLGLPVRRALRVAMFSFEGSVTEFQKEVRRALSKRWPEPFPEGACFDLRTLDLGILRVPNHLPALQAEVRDMGYDLVIVDPTKSFGADGAGSPQDTTDFVRHLVELGLWVDTSWLLLHHFTHGSSRARGPATMGDLVSGAWTQHVDTLLGLEALGNHRAKLTFAKLRMAVGPAPMILEHITPGIRLVGTVDTSVEPSAGEKVYAALEEAGGAMTYAEIEAATSLGERTVIGAIGKLREAGTVIAAGMVGRAKSFAIAPTGLL